MGYYYWEFGWLFAALIIVWANMSGNTEKGIDVDNAELIAELKRKRVEIVLRIKDLNGYIKDLDAVIELFTLLSPKEVALRAINKDPDKTWTVKEMVYELRDVHENRKLDTSGTKGKAYVQIGRSVLNNLLRQRILERVGHGQYKIPVEGNPTACEEGVAPVHNGSDKHERWRQKQLEKGLCIKCSRPATSKTLCDYHRQKKRESYLQQKEIK